MIPYFKLALGAALMALGAIFCLWGYATPRIDGLRAQIADIQARDDAARAAFLAAAQQKEREYEQERERATAAFVRQREESDRMAADLRKSNGVLRGQIAAYASGYYLKLPAAPGGAGRADGPALTLGSLLGDCLDLSAARAADSERLADQVRGLQALMQ